MNLQKDVSSHTRGEEGRIVEGAPEKTEYQESPVDLGFRISSKERTIVSQCSQRRDQKPGCFLRLAFPIYFPSDNVF